MSTTGFFKYLIVFDLGVLTAMSAISWIYKDLVSPSPSSLDLDPLLLTNACDGHEQPTKDHHLTSGPDVDRVIYLGLRCNMDQKRLSVMERNFCGRTVSCNMTIHGVGVDLLHIPRMAALINRRGANKVASRILSPAEQAVFGRASATRFLGVRWAVKEAAYKALYPLRPTWKELTFTTFDPQTGSKPTLVFHPSSSEQHPALHVSVSHDGEYILAYVVAEGA